LSPTIFAAESGFGYPFTEISKTNCRKEAWSTLGNECKMPLPRIMGADYGKYVQDTVMRRVYSVLWGATYDYGWDIGNGSHIGVDIVTSAGTPVIAIGDGKVLTAGWGNGWGNYVTLEHTLSDGTKIYSNYAHLSALSVNKGDAVTRGTKIGEVGNTGNSYGNHLHFQIDVTDQLHPYYYVRCGAGKNPLTIVNTGDCRASLTANTIDPIVFLETGNRSFTPETPSTTPGVQAPKPTTSIPTASTIEAIKTRPTIVIDRSRIKSREELLEEEALEYLRSHRLSLNIPERGVTLAIGSSYALSLESRDLSRNLVTTNIPGPGVTIEFDSKKVSVFPEKVNILEGGKRAITITPKVSGPIQVRFKYGKTIIGTSQFEVLARKESVTVAKVEIKTARSLWLAGEQDIYVAPLTKAGGYVGSQSYKERFVLESIK
jgi:murein DD-endopeptidase MepM/ murein hydrolase activator NlpD